MRITNASYDVRAIAVNKTEIGKEISLQPRSGVWIWKKADMQEAGQQSRKVERNCKP